MIRQRIFIIAACLFTCTSYTYDGQLDTTFGNQGTVVTHFGSNNNNVLSKIVTDENDNILAAGFIGNKYDFAFAVARYLENGTLDDSFNASGTPGHVTTRFLRQNFAEAYSLAVQPDGKIVVAGYAEVEFPITRSSLALARYHHNGTLDDTFGAQGHPLGTVLTQCCEKSFEQHFDQGFTVALQRDGKIVVGGDNVQSIEVARYNQNGTLDRSFNSQGAFGAQPGTVITLFGDTPIFGVGLALQPDNKIIVAGYFYFGTQYVIVRYNADGTLDTTFNARKTPVL